MTPGPACAWFGDAGLDKFHYQANFIRPNGKARVADAEPIFRDFPRFSELGLNFLGF